MNIMQKNQLAKVYSRKHCLHNALVFSKEKRCLDLL